MRKLFVILGLSCCSSGASLAAGHPAVQFVQAVPLDGVEGRIDHMAVDPKGQRLFVAALGNGTVEVIDLRSGRRSTSLRGFDEPQGLAYVASPPRLFVANGGDGTCEMLNGETFAHLRTLRFAGDADNIRFDAGAGRVLVGHGSGSLALVDAATGDSLGNIALPAHPESFQLESNGSRLFANVPDAGQISVIDRAKGHAVAEWRLEGFAANYPMALDETGYRLFVGCRHPAAVLVFDDRSGRRLSAVPIDEDADDLFYDAATRRLMASCGAGFIDVLGAGRAGRFTVIAKVATARGARTALYSPELRQLYLAVPHRGSQRAEIRVFEVSH